MSAAPIEIIDEVVIAGGPQKRHCSRAGMQLLPNGDLFVAFRVGWDMFDRPHGGVVGTWSRDGGRTWDAPLPLVAEPGWDWFGAQRIGEYGWASACGYPTALRLPGGEFFCAFHTDFVDGGSEVRGLFLRDRT